MLKPMKLPALLSATGLALILGGLPLHAAAQQIIYDSITGQQAFGDTDPATTNRHLQGDIVSPVPAPANLQWRIDRIEFVLGIAGAQDQEVALFLGIWRGVNTAAPAPQPVFTDPAPISGILPPAGLNRGVGIIVGRATTTGSGITRTVVSIDFLPSDNVLMPASGPVGITTVWGVRTPGVAGPFNINNRNFGTSLALGSPLIGVSANGFYRDGNSDLIMQAADARTIANTTANLAMRITATAVPEPGTLAGLSIAAIGLISVRRRTR